MLAWPVNSPARVSVFHLEHGDDPQFSKVGGVLTEAGTHACLHNASGARVMEHGTRVIPAPNEGHQCHLEQGPPMFGSQEINPIQNAR